MCWPHTLSQLQDAVALAFEHDGVLVPILLHSLVSLWAAWRGSREQLGTHVNPLRSEAPACIWDSAMLAPTGRLPAARSHVSQCRVDIFACTMLGSDLRLTRSRRQPSIVVRLQSG